MKLGGAESTLFALAAPLSVIGALALLFARKAVHAAMGMALTMVVLGIFYIAQQAEFLGVIQIFVYSGAVMMLFLFVIMLVGVDSSDSLVETIRGQRWAGLLLGLALAALGLATIGKATFPAGTGLDRANSQGNVSGIARLIFGNYVWVFEATSALLITAALGAMMLAHRERLSERPSQADWSRARIKSGRNVAGLPAPGVYARHNAVDTPALLPDGSTSELSISRVLKARGQVATADKELAISQELEGETGDMTRRGNGDDK
ncbi:NADH-quinone oxidoreductase subunit J [Calidifontibacter sp. DB0510]|uniref:NADH-quinone oxidoreductase subunit J n=1 Tax=Metallococcus carri TaxID=1656884 RepID=A0A967E9J3_9MICO|nr:NADH-quinone oxidoreductase subunit J [Metallococcus carri]NHN55260.1 NADH-quinone oxidoreductase subunit J [Metallococcus carri]NOP36337.1 NADH-quinone oxidoreductase subunit J [Calidifontibacter sp. DB2511S]